MKSPAPRQSDYHEPESRILHLLVALAGRPMESDPDHAAALARRVREQRLAEEEAVAVAQAREEAGIIAELRAGEEDDEEAYEDDEDDGRHRRGGYGSDSTLSEWSDAEEGQEREMQQQYRCGQDAAAAAATMTAAGAEDGAGRAWPHEQAHSHGLLPPAMTAAAPQRCVWVGCSLPHYGTRACVCRTAHHPSRWVSTTAQPSLRSTYPTVVL